ncbi:nucleoredoxin-like protein 2 [Cylas formicarius]|uniref:nucleoredoxin-like protein 2 n=1 Tax=Cylas formicarius TaxID=197179 RepID=UPI002958CBD4|nr:nucleoredoxin-like protein 2 [Cylas formicarius]
MDMLEGKMLLDKDGVCRPVKQILKNKKIIIYFFTASYVENSEIIEKLQEVYKENEKRDTGMVIIYVSSDGEEENFKYDFGRQGPWVAIPFKDATADELRYKYDISCLPALVVVNQDGDIITRRGKEELEQLAVNVIVTWSEYVQQ